MPILSDTKIKEKLGKELFIHPLIYPKGQIVGCKVDIHLSGIFYQIDFGKFSEYDPLSTEKKEYRNLLLKSLGEPFVLHPHSFVLGTSLEHFSLPDNLLGILQGRTSLARLGILVHATAGFIDPGYKGDITFELCNVGEVPVKLFALSRIATVAFLLIEGKVEHDYDNEIRSPFKDYASNGYGKQPAEPSKFPGDWEHRVIRRYLDKINENNGENRKHKNGKN